jgi:hypothetical protein
MMQEMWALFAVYQAICTLTGIAVNAAGIPRTGSAPARPSRRDGHRGAFPPDQAALALVTFLAKLLMPGFFTRDRPDRASPRKTKKAGDFPARTPDEPSVTRKIQFHLLCPGRSPKGKAIAGQAALQLRLL